MIKKNFEDEDVNALSASEEMFCGAFVRLNKRYAAYREVFSAHDAKKEHVISATQMLMRKTKIKKRIAELRKILAEKEAFAARDVFKQLVQIATADPAELILIRKTCCRYCHGLNFEYQWIESEYACEAKQAERLKLPAPDCGGGFGFDSKREPHPQCPSCSGEGVENVLVRDLRDVSPAARQLYAGIKKTAYGIEIKLRDQDRALENIAKMLGMFDGNNSEFTGKNNLHDLDKNKTISNDPREAAIFYQELMTGK